MHTLPQQVLGFKTQGWGFKTQGFLLELEQVGALSSHILGGHSCHALRLCFRHPPGGAMQPAARSGRGLAGKAAPTHSSALRSLLPAVLCSALLDKGNEMSNSCALQGTRKGFPGLPHPREGRQAHDDLCELSSRGAELLAKCRGSDAAGTFQYLAGTGVWTKSEEEWPGFACQFSLQTPCALSLALLSFLKMLIKKKKKNTNQTKKTPNNKKLPKNWIKNLDWDLLYVFYPSSICKESTNLSENRYLQSLYWYPAYLLFQ